MEVSLREREMQSMRQKKRPPSLEALYSGALGEIRTPYPLVRSQVLYPDELRARRDRNYTQSRRRIQGGQL